MQNVLDRQITGTVKHTFSNKNILECKIFHSNVEQKCNMKKYINKITLFIKIKMYVHTAYMLMRSK